MPKKMGFQLGDTLILTMKQRIPAGATIFFCNIVFETPNAKRELHSPTMGMLVLQPTDDVQAYLMIILPYVEVFLQSNQFTCPVPTGDDQNNPPINGLDIDFPLLFWDRLVLAQPYAVDVLHLGSKMMLW
jgi:hypothetical protein